MSIREHLMSEKICGLRARAAVSTFLLFSLMGSRQAAADSSGFQLELGPRFSYARSSDQESRFWGVGGGGALELWGLGPLGIMGQASEEVSLSTITLSSEGVSPTLTYISQYSFGPTLNLENDSLRLRVGIGPWFAYSRISEETTEDLTAEDFRPSFVNGSFIGGFVDGRLELNLKVIKPFLNLQVRSQGTRDVEGGTLSSRAPGVDLEGTAGLRLSVFPLLNLSLAGFAGYTNSTLNPLMTSSAVRYGLSAWLILEL